MNPFEAIDPKDKLTENSKSIHYGRYELFFEQIFPFREPLYGQLVLKLKHPHMVEPALALYKKMPDSVQYLIKVYRQKEAREKFIFLTDTDAFVLVYQVADKIWLALENVYFAIYLFAEWLEDCHFFIGDHNAYWLDEYRIEGGMLFFERHFYDNDTYYGILDYYIERARANLKDFAFVRFALHQLYEEMTFRLQDFLKIGVTTKGTAINLVAELAYNAGTVQQTSLEAEAKFYFHAFYTLDKTCSDWVSVNKKYKLV